MVKPTPTGRGAAGIPIPQRTRLGATANQCATPISPLVLLHGHCALRLPPQAYASRFSRLSPWASSYACGRRACGSWRCRTSSFRASRCTSRCATFGSAPEAALLALGFAFRPALVAILSASSSITSSPPRAPPLQCLCSPLCRRGTRPTLQRTMLRRPYLRALPVLCASARCLLGRPSRGRGRSLFLT